MAKVIEFGNRKLEASQTLTIRGLDELMARKSSKDFPTFYSGDDVEEVEFYLKMAFGDGNIGKH